MHPSLRDRLGQLENLSRKDYSDLVVEELPDIHSLSEEQNRHDEIGDGFADQGYLLLTLIETLLLLPALWGSETCDLRFSGNTIYDDSVMTSFSAIVQLSPNSRFE